MQVFLTHDTDRLDVTLADAPAGTSEAPAGRTAAHAGHRRALPATTTGVSATEPSEVIHTTASHPWLTADRGWTRAGTLHVGEAVRLLNGATATVVALHALPGVGPMWDLSLDATHTFAVGDVQAVVHNCGTYEDQVRAQNGDYTGGEHNGWGDTHPDAIRGEGTTNETYIDAKEHPAGATNRQVFNLNREVASPSSNELFETTRGRQLMGYAALREDTGIPFEYWFKNAPAQEVIDTIQEYGGRVVIWPGN